VLATGIVETAVFVVFSECAAGWYGDSAVSSSVGSTAGIGALIPWSSLPAFPVLAALVLGVGGAIL